MDVRGILLALNVVVIFLLLLEFLINDKGEEQTHDEKAFNRWLFLSIAIGVFALPIIIVTEAWRRKREKSSRFEWKDVSRYGLTIMFGSCFNMSLLVLTSCSTTKPVVTERIVYKIDTLYKTNTRADTFRILDSVFVNQYVKGDTVYKEKTAYKWRDKVSVRVDTLYKVAQRTDSVRMPIPVERNLTTWEKTSMRVGKIAICVIIMFAASLMLWLIHRKK